jgi:hypothetical protein
MSHQQNKQTLEIHIKENEHNLMQSLLKKSRLVQQVCKEGHQICWKEEKVSQIEPNTTYRKCKESAHLSLVAHPNSQTRLDISPIWTTITEVEVRKLQPLM